ncbi:MAG: hypothetical protein ABGY75_07565 [Gemmataceae bacterium]
MVATSAAPNRLAPYLSEPKKTLPALPASAEGRSALLSDAVFAAVLALQGQLKHHDPEVVQKAAEMILDFEKTRLRHGRRVVGTERPPVLEPLPPLEPLPQPHPPTPSPFGGGGERTANRANPLDVFIDKVRAELQSQEDAEGTGVIVSRAQAEECARYIRANMHDTPLPPAGRRCHEDNATPAGRGEKIGPGRVVSPPQAGKVDEHPDAHR